jgi:Na+/proline symporter
MEHIDWAGLVQALILLLGAVTVTITIYNNNHITVIKNDIKQINGKLQAQMATKSDKTETAMMVAGDTAQQTHGLDIP